MNKCNKLYEGKAKIIYETKDKIITKKIPVNKLKKLFDLGYHSKKINIIFKRALKK